MNIKICRGNKQLFAFYSMFNTFKGFCRNAEIAYQLRYVISPSVFQWSSHWNNFRDILIICRKSVEKIQVSLNSDKNKNSVHESLCTVMIIST